MPCSGKTNSLFGSPGSSPQRTGIVKEFAPGIVKMAPNPQNSLLFSLLAGNCDAETGSIATDLDECRKLLESQKLAGEFRIAQQRLPFSFQHASAILDDIGASDEIHGAVDVLLDQQKRDAFVRQA